MIRFIKIADDDSEISYDPVILNVRLFIVNHTRSKAENSGKTLYCPKKSGSSGCSSLAATAAS
jgi:hypothetical protein